MEDRKSLCARCTDTADTVNLRSLTIGNKIYVLCKACSKEWDAFKAARSAMFYSFMTFLREQY